MFDCSSTWHKYAIYIHTVQKALSLANLSNEYSSVGGGVLEAYNEIVAAILSLPSDATGLVQEMSGVMLMGIVAQTCLEHRLV